MGSKSFFSFPFQIEAHTSIQLLLLLHLAGIVAALVVGGWYVPKKTKRSAATGIGAACLVGAVGMFFSFIGIMEITSTYKISRGMGGIIFLIFPLTQGALAVAGIPLLLYGLRRDRVAEHGDAFTQVEVGAVDAGVSDLGESNPALHPDGACESKPPVDGVSGPEADGER